MSLISWNPDHLTLLFSVDSRLLLIASANGQVTLFRFVKGESSQDIAVVTLPQLCSSTARSNSPAVPAEVEKHHASTSRLELRRQTENVGFSGNSQHSTDTSVGSQIADSIPIKVRGGHIRRPAGYQVLYFKLHISKVSSNLARIGLSNPLANQRVSRAAYCSLVEFCLWSDCYRNLCRNGIGWLGILISHLHLAKQRALWTRLYSVLFTQPKQWCLSIWGILLSINPKILATPPNIKSILCAQE